MPVPGAAGVETQPNWGDDAPVLYLNDTRWSQGALHALSTGDGTELCAHELTSSRTRELTGGVAGGITISWGMLLVGFGWGWQGSPAGGVVAFGTP